MEHSSNSLVSVIIPACNAEAFIAKTLESVIAQTYRNLEILVVDDGSCDRTVGIVQEYIQKDSRIQLFRQKNAGVAAARNLGIEKSRGEFIAPIDADDIWYPQNLEKQVQFMNQGGSTVGLVYSWSVDIDENDRPTGGFKAARIAGDVYTTFIAHYFIGNGSATMMRRSCLDRVGGYDPKFRVQNAQGCEDWDLYLRIAERYEFQVVPEFLIGYRKASKSMSCDYQLMAKSHSMVMGSVQRRYPQLPQYLFKLSCHNLYLYFAHQSNRCRSHDITRFWLKEAMAAQASIIFIRLGFYQLLLSSIWGSFTQQKTPSTLSIAHSRTVSSPKAMQNKAILFKAPRLNLILMIAFGNAFHWLINVLIEEQRFIWQLRKRPF
jgi:glycosyltransferase involved in cell wall biosynthesis